MLRRGMILHEARISPDLRPLHESMLSQYNDMLKKLPGDTRQVYAPFLFHSKCDDMIFCVLLFWEYYFQIFSTC